MLEKFAARSLVEYDSELIFSKEKFAELIVSDAVNVLREEWYQLNNSEYNQDDPRSVGLHHGMKTGINKSMVLIRKHFGVEE